MKQNELIRVRSADKRLTLETSIFQIFHRGNSTFINSFHKTKFSFHSSTDVVARFLEKLEILSDETFARVDHALKILRSYQNTESAKTTQNHPKPPAKPAKTTYKTNKTNQNDPKPATIYPNTTGLRDICVDGRR